MADDHVPVPAPLPTTLAPALRSRINSALLSGNPNAVGRLLTALTTSAQSTGFNKNLEDYIDASLRASDPALEQSNLHTKSTGTGLEIQSTNQTERDLLVAAIANAAITSRGGEQGVMNNHGSRQLEQGRKLAVPAALIEEGVRVLRMELERVCSVVDEDDGAAGLYGP